MSQLPLAVPMAVPEACTLPTAEQPSRIAEWGSLFTHVLATASLGAQRGRIILPADDALAARARDLAARETSCCSFFTFEFGAGSDESGAPTLTLDVSVPSAQRAVLDSFLSWAEGVRTSPDGVA
ncbi:hypothetical protein [Intrasporangium sp.]|uniref:hypothetical protein n=1 Tax=Intrasporangium sp. TaxID=1925024 RepID=UPI00293B2399|nr:hypothetical protein [Intrasporangium sp.]MDV3220403.1 hypothetical protein [Intrasporangium sp.]